MRHKAAIILGLAVVAILLPTLLSPRRKSLSEASGSLEGGIRCVLDLGAYEDSTHGLINGYNYYLLQEFARDNGIKAEVIAAGRGESWMDSLVNGRVDAVVLPLHQQNCHSEASYSVPVDNLTTWAVSKDNIGLLQAVDRWLDNYHNSKDYQAVHRKFIRVVGNPQRLAENGARRDRLSPYDDLFRKYAASLDWDWRLLAAVAFNESRFHIEARSPRGARGLMQLIPRTADAHQASDPLDPEQNIAAATSYLKRLINIFSNRFTDPDEIVCYALAAYNAGEGTILDSIEEQDMSLQWDYVNSVYEVYEAFCEICP